MDKFFCGKIEDLPSGSGLEVPLHIKKRRLLPPKPVSLPTQPEIPTPKLAVPTATATAPTSIATSSPIDLSPIRPSPVPTTPVFLSPVRPSSRGHSSPVRLSPVPSSPVRSSRGRPSRGRSSRGRPSRVHPSPVTSSPVRSSRVLLSPVPSSPVRPSVVRSSRVRPSPAPSSPARSSRVHPSPVPSSPVRSSRGRPSLVPSSPVRSSRGRPSLVPSSPARSSRVRTARVRPSPVPSSPTRSSRVLPSNFPPSPARSSQVRPSPVSPSPVRSSQTPNPPPNRTPISLSPFVESGISEEHPPRSSSKKRPANTGDFSHPQSGPSPKRTIYDSDINVATFYGSDDDSEDHDDDEECVAPMMMPRGMRVFLPTQFDEVVTPTTVINTQWPPVFESFPEALVPKTEEPDVESAAASETSCAPEHETFLPSNKFDFQWRGFQEPQISPELRREPFSDINCGPTASYSTPYDAFTAIWDTQIMEHIAIETNRYASQFQSSLRAVGKLKPCSRILKWRDTNVDELYVYFAIILATGIVVKSRLEEYWHKTRDIFSTPEFSASMALDRFYLLSKCIHFNDNEECNPELMTPSQAKLFKLQPILDHLNHKFSTLYNMRQNVALDESLTMWKGWLDINQFIRNKAATVGIKTYEVCESQTGYLWRFEVHAGHDHSTSAQEDPISGILPTLVLRLLRGLEHKGHTVWMDNYYNSPALAREMKVRGFDCVGTIRTNRQFVPIELASLEKNQMEPGQVLGCTSGDVDLVVWRDKNRVALISTYHGLATMNCGETLKPTIIHDYNTCMGGVDRKDQMISMYPIERKRTRVWYKKFFKRLLNSSVLNSYILYKTGHNITHRNFRRTLVTQLMSTHMITYITEPIPDTSYGHFPEQYEFATGRIRERLRRRCSFCRKRTTTYCQRCTVPLCLFDCFTSYHTTR